MVSIFDQWVNRNSASKRPSSVGSDDSFKHEGPESQRLGNATHFGKAALDLATHLQAHTSANTMQESAFIFFQLLLTFIQNGLMPTPRKTVHRFTSLEHLYSKFDENPLVLEDLTGHVDAVTQLAEALLNDSDFQDFVLETLMPASTSTKSNSVFDSFEGMKFVFGTTSLVPPAAETATMLPPAASFAAGAGPSSAHASMDDEANFFDDGASTRGVLEGKSSSIGAKKHYHADEDEQALLKYFTESILGKNAQNAQGVSLDTTNIDNQKIIIARFVTLLRVMSKQKLGTFFHDLPVWLSHNSTVKERDILTQLLRTNKDDVTAYIKNDQGEIQNVVDFILKEVSHYAQFKAAFEPAQRGTISLFDCLDTTAVPTIRNLIEKELQAPTLEESAVKYLRILRTIYQQRVGHESHKLALTQDEVLDSIITSSTKEIRNDEISRVHIDTLAAHLAGGASTPLYRKCATPIGDAAFEEAFEAATTGKTTVASAKRIANARDAAANLATAAATSGFAEEVAAGAPDIAIRKESLKKIASIASAAVEEITNSATASATSATPSTSSFTLADAITTAVAKNISWVKMFEFVGDNPNHKKAMLFLHALISAPTLAESSAKLRELATAFPGADFGTRLNNAYNVQDPSTGQMILQNEETRTKNITAFLSVGNNHNQLFLAILTKIVTQRNGDLPEYLSGEGTFKMFFDSLKNGMYTTNLNGFLNHYAVDVESISKGLFKCDENGNIIELIPVFQASINALKSDSISLLEKKPKDLAADPDADILWDFVQSLTSGETLKASAKKAIAFLQDIIELKQPISDGNTLQAAIEENPKKIPLSHINMIHHPIWNELSPTVKAALQNPEQPIDEKSITTNDIKNLRELFNKLINNQYFLKAIIAGRQEAYQGFLIELLKITSNEIEPSVASSVWRFLFSGMKSIEVSVLVKEIITDPALCNILFEDMGFVAHHQPDEKLKRALGQQGLTAEQIKQLHTLIQTLQHNKALQEYYGEHKQKDARISFWYALLSMIIGGLILFPFIFGNADAFIFSLSLILGIALIDIGWFVKLIFIFACASFALNFPFNCSLFTEFAEQFLYNIVLTAKYTMEVVARIYNTFIGTNEMYYDSSQSFLQVFLIMLVADALFGVAASAGFISAMGYIVAAALVTSGFFFAAVILGYIVQEIASVYGFKDFATVLPEAYNKPNFAKKCLQLFLLTLWFLCALGPYILIAPEVVNTDLSQVPGWIASIITAFNALHSSIGVYYWLPAICVVGLILLFNIKKIFIDGFTKPATMDERFVVLLSTISGICPTNVLASQIVDILGLINDSSSADSSSESGFENSLPLWVKFLACTFLLATFFSTGSFNAVAGFPSWTRIKDRFMASNFFGLSVLTDQSSAAVGDFLRKTGDFVTFLLSFAGKIPFLSHFLALIGFALIESGAWAFMTKGEYKAVLWEPAHQLMQTIYDHLAKAENLPPELVEMRETFDKELKAAKAQMKKSTASSTSPAEAPAAAAADLSATNVASTSVSSVSASVVSSTVVSSTTAVPVTAPTPDGFEKWVGEKLGEITLDNISEKAGSVANAGCALIKRAADCVRGRSAQNGDEDKPLMGGENGDANRHSNGTTRGYGTRNFRKGLPEGISTSTATAQPV